MNYFKKVQREQTNIFAREVSTKYDWANNREMRVSPI